MKRTVYLHPTVEVDIPVAETPAPREAKGELVSTIFQFEKIQLQKASEIQPFFL